MNCDKVVKHEEDPLPRTEIKTEPQVNYKFFILYPFLKRFIDILKHIYIIVLQKFDCEIKTEAEEWEHIYVKHEQDVTHDHVSSVKCLKEVKNFVLLSLFIYLL